MELWIEPPGTKLACPCCPLCGEPPFLVLVGAVQAFCGNEDCMVLSWNPSRCAEENLADQREHHLDGDPRIVGG
jgi:hypothetical protein